MTLSGTASITIFAPIATVFDYFADLDNIKEYSPEIESIARRDSGPLQVGSVYMGMNKAGKRSWETTSTIKELSRPSKLVWEVEESETTWTCELSETEANATLVSISFASELGGFMSLAMKATRRGPKLNEGVSESLETAKAKIEAGG